MALAAAEKRLGAAIKDDTSRFSGSDVESKEIGQAREVLRRERQRLRRIELAGEAMDDAADALGIDRAGEISVESGRDVVLLALEFLRADLAESK